MFTNEREMNNFFLPFLFSHLEDQKIFDVIPGDFPFFFYLAFMAYHLERTSLEPLIEIIKKSAAEKGDYNITPELKNMFYESNSLYMAKVITLAAERYPTSICLVGNFH